MPQSTKKKKGEEDTRPILMVRKYKDGSLQVGFPKPQTDGEDMALAMIFRDTLSLLYQLVVIEES